jgi:endonuclease/exonuclease/phosphatase (EEP) superfamily protein YafD
VRNRISIPLLNKLTLFIILVGFFDKFWPFFLLSQFRLFYLAISTVWLIILTYMRKPIEIAVAVTGICLNLYAMDVFTLYAPLATQPTAQVKFKLLEMNVQYNNMSHEKAAALIKETNADIVVIEELTPLWAKSLSDCMKAYPHRVLSPQDSTYGNGVYSKYPIQQSKIGLFCPRNHPTIKVDLDIENNFVSLIHTHLQGPVSPRYFAYHYDDAQGVSEMLKESFADAILCGDMNSSSWCNPLKSLIKNAHMVDSRQGRGLQLSWPTKARPPYFPILAIDHCFARGNLAVVDRKLGPYFGSDHFPVITSFAFTR